MLDSDYSHYAHNTFREIVEPEITLNRNDSGWCEQHQELIELYNSFEAFSQKYPKSTEKASFIKRLLVERDNHTLATDHTLLQKVLFPSITHAFDYPKFLREQHHDLRLFTDAKLFENNCPTHVERLEYLGSRIIERAEFKEKSKETARKQMNAMKKLWGDDGGPIGFEPEIGR